MVFLLELEIGYCYQEIFGSDKLDRKNYLYKIQKYNFLSIQFKLWNCEEKKITTFIFLVCSTYKIIFVPCILYKHNLFHQITTQFHKIDSLILSKFISTELIIPNCVFFGVIY